MVARKYSNIAVETTLASGIGSGDSSLVVASDTGWPASPFVLIIDEGEATEELILVGSKAGSTFGSLTRGFGGTSAAAHSGGAVIKHTVVAEDASLIWSHIHSGAGGDDTAQINHPNLTGISADDHHLEDHAGRHASGGPDPISHDVIAGVSADDHHTENHTARHASGGADELNHASLAGVSLSNHHSEVEGAIEDPTSVPPVSPTFGDMVILPLTIPATWAEWRVFVDAVWWPRDQGGTIREIDYRLRIDGVDQTLNFGPADGSPHALHGFRSGITTTGVRNIVLRASQNGGVLGNTELEQIFLHARAVRVA